MAKDEPKNTAKAVVIRKKKPRNKEPTLFAIQGFLEKKADSFFSSWNKKLVVIQNKQLKYYNLTKEDLKKIEKGGNDKMDYMPTSSTEKDPDGILNFDFYKCNSALAVGGSTFKIDVKDAKRDFTFRALSV